MTLQTSLSVYDDKSSDSIGQKYKINEQDSYMGLTELFSSDKEWFWRLLRFMTYLISPAGMRNKITILIYHQVLSVDEPVREDCITRDEFDQQMAIISKVFHVISIDQALAYLDQGKIPPRSVVITFDDGYANNYYEALPVLKKYDLPATLYVVGSAVQGGELWNDTVYELIHSAEPEEIDLNVFGMGKQRITDSAVRHTVSDQLITKFKTLPPDEQNKAIRQLRKIIGCSELDKRNMLTAEELVKLSEEPRMTIGSHTMWHPMLSYIGITDAENDVKRGKEYIEEIIKKPIEHFAYPYGKYGKHFHAEHLNMIAALGFKSAVTTNWGSVNKDSSRYFLQRFTPWDKNPIKFFLRICLNYNK
ncbi:MAG: polysaccharide deacetylase family protein [Sedimenticola sp.]|nr:polysaccharide deacetylase family protein [Sedimenticola sp.]